MILEGLLSIQDGEKPRIIREKLNAFTARADMKAVKPLRKARKGSRGQCLGEGNRRRMRAATAGWTPMATL
jgi:hypothetical protein